MILQVVPKIRPSLTQSLFPETRKLLLEADVRKALAHVAPADVLASYVGPVDFLFCEIVTSYRETCRAFYAENGTPLCRLSVSTWRKLKQWDMLLVGALKVATEIHRQGLSLPWEDFRDAVLQIAASPPA
ncbi:MAG: hypothetical protein V1745_00265 [Patescibacteria group bacterium]